MKIYVQTDLEGVAGVSRWDQTGPGEPGYPEACRLMTEELRALVAGIRSVDGGADIWVCDSHGPGAILIERFPRGARLMSRGPKPAHHYLDPSFDAMFFFAQHAMAGARDANLAHTYSSRNIEYYRLNGREMGEFGCLAAIAGSFGVPAVFVSGDDKMMQEARALVPDIACAEVKVGLALQYALSLAPEDARDLVRDVAAEATRRAGEIAPFVLDGPPYTHEVCIWARTDPVDWLRRGYTQTGARTFVKTAERLVDLNL